jgi:hypothetical protein
MKRSGLNHERNPINIAGQEIAINNTIHDLVRDVVYVVYRLLQGEMVAILYHPANGLQRFDFSKIEKAIQAGQIRVYNRTSNDFKYGYVSRGR